jgi:hypothetical protein
MQIIIDLEYTLRYRLEDRVNNNYEQFNQMEEACIRLRNPSECGCFVTLTINRRTNNAI